MKTGRRLRISRALVVAFATGALWIAAVPVAADGGNLLLPGIDIRDVDFTVGAWCRYRVIDEAEGARDTSEVYIAVTARESGKEAWWMEIATAPAGADPGETDTARFLVDGSVRTMAPTDSLYRYVSRLYIRKGRGPVEAGNPRDLTRLTIVNPTSESGWKVSPDSVIATPAGNIRTVPRSFENIVTREIPAGNVKIVQHNEDRVRVWRSDSVPVFHLAGCVIERVRDTRTIPPVQGIPPSGPRRSRTVSVLVAYGMDAAPLLPVPGK
jgi:hypothetical protein